MDDESAGKELHFLPDQRILKAEDGSDSEERVEFSNELVKKGLNDPNPSSRYGDLIHENLHTPLARAAMLDQLLEASPSRVDHGSSEGASPILVSPHSEGDSELILRENEALKTQVTRLSEALGLNETVPRGPGQLFDNMLERIARRREEAELASEVEELRRVISVMSDDNTNLRNNVKMLGEELRQAERG